MSDFIRSFIAVEFPENIISHIRNIQENMKKKYRFDIKWVKPENIHLTLRFLGNIRPEDTETLRTVMTEAVKGYKPFSLGAKGIGVFPNIRKARVIWLGLKGDTFPLTEFQKQLEENLQIMGFPKEDKLFKAHLTLARVKAAIDAEKLGSAITEFSTSESETFSADKIILFKSELKPSGPVYTKLVSVDF